jgi:methionine synthase II (cobalamin-independent)
LRVVRDLLGELDPAGGVAGLPYLPELPDRGPGADLVGRSLGLLVGMPVDLQPSGWRLVDRAGRDAARTAAFWREDLDELSEAFDGYAGALKVAVAGPWTLAASVWLNRGERALVDDGATRDLADSLAEGVRVLLADLQRQVPGVRLVLQVDEPSLPAVLEGRLPTASGFGTVRAVEAVDALPALQAVLAAAGERATVVHCCAAYPPLPLLRSSGATGLSVDTTALTPRGWEGLAVAVEDGRTLYAGCVPTSPEGLASRSVAERVTDAWSRIGLPVARLAELVVTPTCGLAGLAPAEALAAQRRVVEVARELTERSQG